MAMFSQIALSIRREHLQIILCKQRHNRFCILSHSQLSGISDSSPDSSSSLALLWNRLFGSANKQMDQSINAATAWRTSAAMRLEEHIRTLLIHSQE
jgi:hypothetical protein